MLFSVITINYNNRIGLQKTINSVIEQSFDDYEYIVIDGGSSDGSKDVLVENDPYISYWVSEKSCKNPGSYAKTLRMTPDLFCL